VARFESDPYPTRNGGENFIQSTQINLKVSRKLHQDRTQFFSKMLRSFHQAMHRFVGLFEPTNMTQITTCLNSNDKIIRRDVSPTLESAYFRQSVE